MRAKAYGILLWIGICYLEFFSIIERKYYELLNLKLDIFKMAKKKIFLILLSLRQYLDILLLEIEFCYFNKKFLNPFRFFIWHIYAKYQSYYNFIIEKLPRSKFE